MGRDFPEFMCRGFCLSRASRHQPALTSAFRLAHCLPLGNPLDLAGAGFAVRAVSAGLGLAEHPLVKFFITA
jgi:hypothetical protein